METVRYATTNYVPVSTIYFLVHTLGLKALVQAYTTIGPRDMTILGSQSIFSLGLGFGYG